MAEISMSREPAPWLILEGPSDEIFFSTKSLPRKPKCVPAQGWENVVEVIQKVKAEQINALVLGFVDRDYREDINIIIDEACIVVTDFRDLEISMFESKVLDRILAEYSSVGKAPSFKDGGMNIKEVRKEIYAIASQLGKLRFFSLARGYHYSFPDDIVKKVFDKENKCLQQEKLRLQISQKSQEQVDIDRISEILCSTLPSRLQDDRNLCCGHDVIAVFSMLLRHAWKKGNVDAKALKDEQIAKLFRIGYSDEEFYQTDMGQKLIRLLQPVL